MRIVSRYIFRQAAGTMVLIVLSLTAVVWIALALRQLNLVTSQGQDTLAFLKITLLGLPSLMAVVGPIALLIAVIHVLNRLGTDSELIVLTAAGATVWTPARPLLLLALMTTAGVIGFNLLIMPWSNHALRQAIIEVRTDLITQVVQPGRFTSPEKGLTFHVRDRTNNGELLGLVMHDTRDEKQIVTFLAERARIVKQGDDAFLLMQGGHILRRPTGEEPIQIIEFQSYGIDLARFEPKTAARAISPRERYLGDLLTPSESDRANPRLLGLIRAELHERFSSPLYPLAFTLLALALVGPVQSTRQGRGKALALAFILATTARVGGLAATNLVSIRAAAVPLVYALPVVVAVLAIILAQWRMRPRRRSALAMWVARAWGGLVEGWGARLAPSRLMARRKAVRP